MFFYSNFLLNFSIFIEVPLPGRRMCIGCPQPASSACPPGSLSEGALGKKGGTEVGKWGALGKMGGTEVGNA